MWCSKACPGRVSLLRSQTASVAGRSCEAPWVRPAVYLASPEQIPCHHPEGKRKRKGKGKRKKENENGWKTRRRQITVDDAATTRLRHNPRYRRPLRPSHKAEGGPTARRRLHLRRRPRQLERRRPLHTPPRHRHPPRQHPPHPHRSRPH